MAKKVLALGGAGFIGSYVVRELLQHGYQVTCVDNFSKYGPVTHDFFSNPDFQLRNKDVRNLSPIDFKGYDFVLALAALIGGIKYFHKIPYQIARDNTQILTHAIDNTLAVAPEAIFVYFSSSMVYERMQRPVSEQDCLEQLVPLTNYGMQKLFGEFVTRGAREEYGLNYLIVRPFNAVGSGELPEMTKEGQVEFGMAHVIPDFVYKALVRESPFQILGDGKQVRTFTHARDVAVAVRMMLDKGIKNEDFNVCGDSTCSVGELASIIWKKVNPGITFPGFIYLPAQEADVRCTIGKADKAKAMLGWEPKYHLNDIIEDVVDFIRPWAEHRPVHPRARGEYVHWLFSAPRGNGPAETSDTPAETNNTPAQTREG